MATLSDLRNEVKYHEDQSVVFLNETPKEYAIGLTSRKGTIYPRPVSPEDTIKDIKDTSVGAVDSVVHFMNKFKLHTICPRESAGILKTFANFSKDEKQSTLDFFKTDELPEWAWTSKHPTTKFMTPAMELLNQWSKTAVTTCRVNYLLLYQQMNNIDHFGGICHAIYMHQLHDQYRAVEDCQQREALRESQEEKNRLVIQNLKMTITTKSQLQTLVDKLRTDLLYQGRSPSWFWDSATEHMVMSMYNALGSIIDMDLFMSDEDSYRNIRKSMIARVQQARTPTMDTSPLNEWLVNLLVYRRSKIYNHSDFVENKKLSFAVMQILGQFPAVEQCGHSGASAHFTFGMLQYILSRGWNFFIIQRLAQKGIGV